MGCGGLGLRVIGLLGLRVIGLLGLRVIGLLGLRVCSVRAWGRCRARGLEDDLDEPAGEEHGPPGREDKEGHGELDEMVPGRLKLVEPHLPRRRRLRGSERASTWIIEFGVFQRARGKKDSLLRTRGAGARLTGEWWRNQESGFGTGCVW